MAFSCTRASIVFIPTVFLSFKSIPLLAQAQLAKVRLAKGKPYTLRNVRGYYEKLPSNFINCSKFEVTNKIKNLKLSSLQKFITTTQLYHPLFLERNKSIQR